MRHKWSGVAALGLVMALVAGACGGSDGGGEQGSTNTTEDTTTKGCEATVPGTQINYGVYAPTSSLDPPQVSGGLVGGSEILNIYDALVTYNFDTDEYEPRLAESLEPNDDFTVWTLKLRPNITYSDGTPLDAKMVADNIDRYLQPGVRNASGAFLALISEKTVVDPQTLRVTLAKPWSQFQIAFAFNPGLIANLNAVGADPEAFGAKPPDAAGVGPYVVEKNTPGEELVLKARPNYWDGPVCIETLRFVFVPGAQATSDAFRAGDVNVAFLRDDAVIANALDSGAKSFMIPQQGGGDFIINHREGHPGADLDVREAIGLSMDIDVINQRAFSGTLDTYKALVGPQGVLYSDDIKPMETSVDKAKAAFDRAKAKGYDGKLNLVCSNAAPVPETALAAQALLESVGFTVTNDSLPGADQIGRVNKGDYDIACAGMNAGPSTALIAYNRNLRSPSSGNQSNRMGYDSPEMDAALDKLFAAPDVDTRKKAMAEVNDIFNKDYVAVVYGATREGIIWAPEVKGIIPTAATEFLFANAYISN